MESRIIFVITALSFCVYAAILISIPFRTKRNLKSAGKKLMTLKSEFPVRLAAIFVVCAALIAVVPLTRFEIYLRVIFCAVALIGSEISAREAANTRHSGVYEKMIISESLAVKYEDIFSLPTLAYENDSETTSVDKKNLEIICKNGGKATILFADENTRALAVEIILRQCTRLKS